MFGSVAERLTIHRGDSAAAAALRRPAGVHLGRALRQEVRTGRPAERVSRALEAHHVEHRSPAEQSMDAYLREQPGPSGLQRISTFEREFRQAIETTAKALRACRRELRQLEERVARWIREMHQRVREAEARRQREREWSRKLEQDRDDDLSFDRDHSFGDDPRWG